MLPYFLCVVCLFFVLIFCVFFVMYFLVVFYIFFIFNLNFNRNRQNIITMKFQDVSCPSLTESVLSSSSPSQSLAVSVSSSLDVTVMTRRSTWSSKAMSVA